MSPPQRIRYPGGGPILQGARPGQIVSVPASGLGGTIPSRTVLNALANAPVSAGAAGYATLLTTNITVLGGASKIWIVGSIAGFKTNIAGTLFLQLRVDGVDVGNPNTVTSLGSSDGSSLVFPALASGARSTPGAHAVTLVWHVDSNGYRIDSTSPTPAVNFQNASLFAREVPA